MRRPSCVHPVDEPLRWLAARRRDGSDIVGVDLAEEATTLLDRAAAACLVAYKPAGLG